MLTWTGHGWIGALFMFLAFVGVHTWFGPDGWSRPLPLILMVLGGSTLCYGSGRFLNRGLRKRFVALSGDDVGHTLACVRLEYAGILIVPVLILGWLDRAGVFD